MEEILSVIVPVYNAEKYLRQCVDSILAQTYKKIEIVLVNDGSTDGSGAICDEYAREFNNVSAVHKENEGVIKARFDGVMEAKGDYVTFVDSDDWIKEDMYSHMMSYISESDLVISQIYRYYSDENIVAEGTMFETGLYKREDIQRDIIPNMMYCKEINRWAIDPSLCTKIFCKDRLIDEMRKVKTLDMWYGDDTSIIFSYILKVDKLYITNGTFYYHRQKDKGETASYIRDDLFVKRLESLYNYLDCTFKKSQYYEVLKPQLEQFYKNSVEKKQNDTDVSQDSLVIEFPASLIKENSKVILYGAGKVGKEYVEQNEINNYCHIIKWVDRRFEYIVYKDYKIESPDSILHSDFDYVIIAIDIFEAAMKVKEYLLNLGIEENKIIWRNGRKSDAEG